MGLASIHADIHDLRAPKAVMLRLCGAATPVSRSSARRLVPYVGIDRRDLPGLPGRQTEWHATRVTHRHPHIYAPGP